MSDWMSIRSGPVEPNIAGEANARVLDQSSIVTPSHTHAMVQINRPLPLALSPRFVTDRLIAGIAHWTSLEEPNMNVQPNPAPFKSLSRGSACRPRKAQHRRHLLPHLTASRPRRSCGNSVPMLCAA